MQTINRKPFSTEPETRETGEPKNVKNNRSRKKSFRLHRNKWVNWELSKVPERRKPGAIKYGEWVGHLELRSWKWQQKTIQQIQWATIPLSSA
jgi:hypothetical protein